MADFQHGQVVSSNSLTMVWLVVMWVMAWKLTVKQRAYRKYLKSDHWKVLRAAAVTRDGGKCVRCGSVEKPHVHHVVYREKFEDGVLEDLETLCRDCHRAEHGRGPGAFGKQWFKVRDLLRKTPAVGDRIDRHEWVKLRRLIEFPEDWEEFADLVAPHVREISGSFKAMEWTRHRLYQRAERMRQEEG